ncbi:MAG: hypothetical protein MUO88_11965 [Desulfobacterales bacterium]|nr:hypothetical protein [Desulfobacterales bacterium]
MSDISYSNASPAKVGLLSEILRSFSIPMLPWSLAYAILGGLTGFYYYKTRQAGKDKSKLIIQLQASLSEIKMLSGLLPICSSCKKIRDDKGYWNQIESYIREHSEAEFTHSICPECSKKLYPDFYKENNSTTKA